MTHRMSALALLLATACQPGLPSVMKEPPVPNLDWEPPAQNAAFTVPGPPPSPRPLVVATSGGERCPLLLLLEDGRVYRCSAGALQAGRVPDAEALHARFLGLRLLSAPPLVDVVPSDVDSPGTTVCVSEAPGWVCASVSSMWPGRPREEHEAAARGAPIQPRAAHPGELGPPALTAYARPVPEPVLAANDLLLSLEVEWTPAEDHPVSDHLYAMETARLRSLGLVIK